VIKSNLSRILGERRISQADLARRAELNPNTVMSIYNEKAKGINFDTLEAICKALDCQPGDLLEYVPDEAQDGRKR
jgi:putative transcriptional regulator